MTQLLPALLLLSLVLVIARRAHAARNVWTIGGAAGHAARIMARPSECTNPLTIMQAPMLRTGKDFEVLWTVIRFVAIAMMDFFVACQRTSNHLLHNNPMFPAQFALTALPKADIAMLICMASTLPALMLGTTGMGAEPALGWVGWIKPSNEKLISAVQASPGYGTLSGHHNLLRYGDVLPAVTSSAGALLCPNYSMGKG